MGSGKISMEVQIRSQMRSSLPTRPDMKLTSGREQRPGRERLITTLPKTPFPASTDQELYILNFYQAGRSTKLPEACSTNTGTAGHNVQDPLPPVTDSRNGKL